MKKVVEIIRNIYRVTLSKPTGIDPEIIVKITGQVERGRSKRYRNSASAPFIEMNADSYLRKAIHNDALDLEPDPDILQMLAGRVEARRKPVKGNSFFVIPVFLFKNLELKMAAITLIIIIALGVNPSVQYQANRKISPFSLADTLIDSSKLDVPFLNHQTP